MAYYNSSLHYEPGDEIWIDIAHIQQLGIFSPMWEHLACAEGPDHVWCRYRRTNHQEETEPSTLWASSEPTLTLAQFQQEQQMKRTPKDPLNLPLAQAFGMAKALLQKGDIGLEIEAEGKSLFNSPISFWNCHIDQSLRHVDQHPPIEYVLKQPLSRKGVSDALTYLLKKLKAAGSEIRMSYRCSVHVHVNCQRLTMKQIYQYILLYMIFEDMLVNFSGKDRVGNFFCLRAKDAEYWVKVLQDSIKTMQFTELFNDNWRYTSCNTASLGKFGSLEFRSMRGTIDQKLIETWIDLLCHIRDVAIDFDSPKAIAEFFVTAGPTKFFNAVFDDAPRLKGALQGNKTTVEINKSLWDGLRLMRDVAYSTDWDKKYEPPPKPKKSNWVQDNDMILGADDD